MDPARWTNLETLLRHLNGAAKTMTLYPATHPAAVKFQLNIVQSLEALLKDQDSTQIGITEENLVVVEGTPWMGPGEQVAVILDRMRKRDIGTLTVRRGITLEDVRGLLEILSADPAVLAAQGGAGRALAAKGTSYVVATSLKPSEGDPSVGSLDRKQVVVVYNKAVGAARALMQKVAMGHVPQALEVRQVVEGLTEAVLKEKYTILGLTRLKSYDEYLFNHSVNVGILSVALGHALGLDPEVLREVGFGAFLHDIGKLNWPEALYRKPRKLNESEWELVRRHPGEGLKILERMGASQIAKSITLEHHVRVDRDPRGYPVLPGNGEPSFFGRLAAVADGYDAMTSHRAYRQAMEPTKAVALISSLAGTVYDPKLTEAFVRMLGIYPVGTLVRLTTRELAVVLRPQDEPSRPVVRLVAAADGTVLEDGAEINLMEKHPRTNDYVRGILLPVDPSAKNIDVGRFLKPAE